MSCAWYWWTKWTAKINAMSWSGLCVFVWCQLKSTLGHCDRCLLLDLIASHPHQAEVLLQNTHHLLPGRGKIWEGDKGGCFEHLENIRLTWNGMVLLTLRTSAHPKEVCDPNDRVVQLQLHKLQAKTLKIILSGWWKVAGNAWHKIWWPDENVRRKNCWLAEPPDTSQVSQLECKRGFDFWKTWHKRGVPHKQQGGAPSFLRIQGFSMREKWSWFPFVLPS